MSSIWDNLNKYSEKHGWRIRMLSVEHLQDLQDDVQMLHSQDLFDEEFFQERLSWFRFRVPDDLPKAKSLIVVAVPRPQSQAVFNWKGEPRVLTIPPTYVAYDEVRNRVEDSVTKIMSTDGYNVSRTRLPLKLLAVRSGLGFYGRNNICYVPSMGSFLQLVAVYSDMQCVKETWQEVQMMERCQDCYACRLQCPTNAISSDRFLLHAERCIVFHNERKGEIPFPDWIDVSWHNSVVGCMHCQRVCPENKDFLQWMEGKEEFSEEETTFLLQGVSLDQLPITLIEKLKNLDMVQYLDSLPRNLGIFFMKQ